MAFNAFVGGIQPGGLTNDFEVKILICFLLDSLKKNSPGAALSDGEQPGLSFDELNEIFQETGLVNYFEFAESMSELEKTEHIRRQMTPDGEKEIFVITEVGSITAQTFQKTLPLTVREKTLETARHLTEVQKCMDEVDVNYHPVSDGYILQLTIRDIGSDLLNLNVFLPTEEECILVKENIQNDPAEVYSRILTALIEK
ncbi:DUF4364 family protein [Negativibacillus massiliensis]|uniref:DUF4364 family protein n=1 Tax=Negativibacillus massiliensis TaxID=1871035 RepID=UPI003AF2091B